MDDMSVFSMPSGLAGLESVESFVVGRKISLFQAHERKDGRIVR